MNQPGMVVNPSRGQLDRESIALTENFENVLYGTIVWYYCTYTVRRTLSVKEVVLYFIPLCNVRLL